jgi:PKD repeat protein
MKSKLFIAAICLMIGSTAGKLYSQDIKICGLSEKLEELILKDPSMLAQMEAYQKYQAEYAVKQSASKIASQKYVIPVVFHVIHNYGPENITDAQIIQAINVMNRDYSKMNADTITVRSPFNSIIANCNFEFRLAQKDPNGNCTNGIEHIQSSQTYGGADGQGSHGWAKLNQWPRNKYLNIWVSNSIMLNSGFNAAGYAYQPPNVNGFDTPIDGVMALFNYIGDNGASNSTNSRTLTHEVGHYLGLSHPWGNTNSCGVACGDDGIADTPPTQGQCNCINPLDFTCSKQTLSKMFTFDSVTTTSGLTDPTPIAKGADSTLLTYSSFSANNVLSDPSVNKEFSFTNWGTGAIDQDTSYASLTGNIDLSKYYEVTLTAKYARAFDINAINFSFHRSATGTRTFAVRSSRDNYGTNLAATYTKDTLISIRSGNVFYCKWDTTLLISGCTVNIPNYFTNSSVTFRFYGWNAEDAAGAFGIENANFVIDGGTNENVENYMNYSYCCKMFTLNQKSAMEASLNSTISARNNLWSAANLTATGVDGTPQTCAPKADFHMYKADPTSFSGFACTGTNVIFYDDSWGGTATSRTWTFTDGTPSTSTTANQTVTYSTPGWKTVSLTVTNSTGTNTKTGSVYISQAGASQYTGSYSEDFENKTRFDNEWFINNMPVDINNTSAWKYTNAAHYSGSGSIMLNAFFSPLNNYPFSSNATDMDEIITPSVDLTGVSPLYFSFRYSYASKAAKIVDITESLKIYASSTCGQNWSLVSTKLTNGKLLGITGSDLASGGTNNNPYTPTSSLWRSANISLSATWAKPNVRFKFVYTASDYSNNLYIDDVNIGSTTISVVGVNEAQEALNSLSVFPNPSSETATIAYHLGKKQNVDLGVYDMLGNKVMTLVNQSQQEGDYSYIVGKQDIAKGMYFIRLGVDEKSSTVRKFILLD